MFGSEIFIVQLFKSILIDLFPKSNSIEYDEQFELTFTFDSNYSINLDSPLIKNQR